MDKIINPKSGKLITIGKDSYNKLIKEGYFHDKTTNKLIIPLNTLSPLSPLYPLSNDDLTIKSLDFDNYVFDEIIHISDTHIPIHLHVKRKDEYLIVFDRIYNFIKQRKNIGIIITGDLLNTKLNIEAETYIMARNFLETLSNICPVVNLIGNHDFTENNLDRIDSMTAVCHNLKVKCLKYTGLYKFGNILLSFSSLYDKKFIYYNDIPPNPLPIYKVFHGTLIGSKNFNNTTYKDNPEYHSLKDFEGYNAVLLGHIHKYQSFNNGHIAYAGSTIQQHIGESIDYHGLLIWNTHTHTHTFHNIDNDYVFIDIHIDNGIILNYDQLNKYKHKFLRIRCQNKNTSQYQYQEIVNELKNSYKIDFIQTGKPTNILPFNSSINANSSIDSEINLIIKHGNPNLHNEIIKLHKSLKNNDTCNSSYDWTIINIKFKNMFIYGNDFINEIDFINGVHNICSANTTGKSSIMYIIIFALFGTSSDNSSKKSDVLNINKNDGFVELTFSSNGSLYLIVKKSKIKNKTISFDTDFFKIDNDNKILLNGKDSTHTMKIIKQYVGDYDSFIIHNVISPKSLSLLYMKPADRLIHFHKLCDTDQYINYCTLVSSYKKIATSKLEKSYGQKDTFNKINTDIDIVALENSLLTLNNQIHIINNQIKEYINSENILSYDISILKDSIQHLKSQIINIDEPINEIHDIHNILYNILHDLNIIDPDQSIYNQIKTQTIQSLNTIISSYKSNIVDCKYSYDDVINHLNYLNNSSLNLNKPIKTLNEYNDLKIITSIKLNDLKNKIDSLLIELPNYPNYEYQDINNKNHLLHLKTNLENYINSVKFPILNLSLDELIKEIELIKNTDIELIKDPEFIIENQTIQSLNIYKSLIIPCDFKLNDIIDNINSLNITINNLNSIKPIDDYNSLYDKYIKLDYNNKQIIDKINNLSIYLPLFPNYKNINIDKNELINKLNILQNNIINIDNINNNIDFYYNKLQNININDIVLSLTPNQIKETIQINIDKINIINNELSTISLSDIIETNYSFEELNNSLKELIHINDKIDINTNDIDDIHNIFSNIEYNSNNFAINIHYNTISKFKSFVQSVQNGTYYCIAYNKLIDQNISNNNIIQNENNIIKKQIKWLYWKSLNDQLKTLQKQNINLNLTIQYLELQSIIDFLNLKNQISIIKNQLNDIHLYEQQTILEDLIKLNISYNNDIIILKNNIDWFEKYNTLNTKLSEYNNFLKIAQNNILYENKIKIIQKHLHLLELNNNISYINNNNELIIVNHKLNKILEYEKQLLLNKYIIDQNILNNEISIFNDSIKWFKDYDIYINDLDKFNNYKNILLNNDILNKQISDVKIQLDVLLLHNKYIEYNKLIKNIEISNNNNILNNQISKLNIQYSEALHNLNIIKSTLASLYNTLNTLNTEIAILNNNIQNYHKFQSEINLLNNNILELEHDISIYNEYIHLFSKTNIPFKIMTLKLTTFDDSVNSIFGKYTKYNLHIDQSDSGKLIFYIQNKINNCLLDIDSLSGFESIILILSINQAILNIASKFKCRLILIDEAFDCIDQIKFVNELPFIIDTIKHYYSTIILISHREVPSYIIDKNIVINYHNTWSSIKNTF